MGCASPWGHPLRPYPKASGTLQCWPCSEHPPLLLGFLFLGVPPAPRFAPSPPGMLALVCVTRCSSPPFSFFTSAQGSAAAGVVADGSGERGTRKVFLGGCCLCCPSPSAGGCGAWSPALALSRCFGTLQLGRPFPSPAPPRIFLGPRPAETGKTSPFQLVSFPALGAAQGLAPSPGLGSASAPWLRAGSCCTLRGLRCPWGGVPSLLKLGWDF